MYDDVLHMGTLVEEALRKALTAVSTRDEALAESVIAGDDAIDSLQFRIDEQCTKLIATEQPVATDLREILVAMKITADLERIGDHARHLVRVRKELAAPPFADVVPRFREMMDTGVTMLHDSITAYVNHDADLAERVARRDDEIDAMHRSLFRDLVEILRRNPDHVEAGTSVIFMNRFLERLGDHVTNMCEWIVYAKTGVHRELNKR